MKTYFALLGLLLVALGCATESRIAATPSGLPEVTINTYDMEAVKASIITKVAPIGYTLQSDSNYRLFFTRQTSGLEAAFTQVLIGNSYSTTPEKSLNITIFKAKQSVRVMASGAVSTQMAFGQVRSVNLSEGSRWFNDLQRILFAVKEEVEQAEVDEKSSKGVDGTEITRSSRGATYVGDKKNGLPNGTGTYIWPSGTKYVGDWRDGKMHGQGTISWPNGNTYSGEWRDDSREGYGVFTHSDGRVEKGIWRGNALVEKQSGK